MTENYFLDKAKELFATAFNLAQIGEYESGDGFTIITKLPDEVEIKVLDTNDSEVIITQNGNIVFHAVEDYFYQFAVLVFEDNEEWIEVLNTEFKQLSTK